MPVRLKRLLVTLFCALGVMLTLAQAAACAEATASTASALAWLDDPGASDADGSDPEPSFGTADIDDDGSDPGVLRTASATPIPTAGEHPHPPAPGAVLFLTAPDLRPPTAA